MYHNTAYTDAQLNNGRSFWINSCGHEANFNHSSSTFRPAGRTDYLLLLVISGLVEFHINGSPYLCPAGTAVLYGPNQPQKYHHLFETNPASMWIHFTGKEVDSMLKSLQLRTESFYKIAYPSNLANMITDLISELQNKDLFYTESASLILQNILLYVAKNSIPYFNTQPALPNAHSYEIKVPADVSKIVTYLNTHYTETLEIGEIAEQLHLSHSRLIALFKKFECVTPKQYIINLRIRKARELLENSSLSISEIAAKVGYPNALYFSRIFKKNTGISPTQYRIKNY